MMKFTDLSEEERGKLLETFFILRFKRHPEHDPTYFDEWRGRFATGHPEGYMDSDTLAVFNSLLESPYYNK